MDRVIDQATGWTTGQLRARLRKLILAIDPQAAKKTYATAMKSRRVECFDNPDGTGELWGRNLPPQDAAAAWERLTAIARAAKAAGDPRCLQQLRVDAFLDLLVGEGVATGGPLTHHTGGLTAPATADVEPTDAASPEAPGPPATEPVGALPEGWDPAWPLEPWEPIGPHDVHPDPTGEPVDRFDDAGHDFDGPGHWPADWPGRWTGDPAVKATAGVPTRSCTRCGQLGGLPTGPLPAPRRGVVELQVPLTTALGIDDLPGELNGYGPVLGEMARQIIDQMPDTQWRFSVYSRLPELAMHGILAARPTPSIDRDGSRRRPTAAQAAFVRARDRTCRAPGCRRPARVRDLDHSEPWVKGGKTTTCNLGCLCRAHHLFRHSTGCELIQLSPGVFTWQTPRGLQYVTRQDPPLLDLQQLRL